MPIDLRELVSPAHTVLLTQECQVGVIGPQSALPALAEVARRRLIPNVAALAACARGAGVRVIHCLAGGRADGFGRNANARLFGGTRKSPVRNHLGTPAVSVVPEIGVAEQDVVLTRMQGLSPFGHSELDPILRNAGIRTIVATGVSVNVALMALAFEAVNAGYQVVMPRDAVAGVPEDYVEAVLQNTLGLVVTLTTTSNLLALWGG
jgi:nicotinamidase-related amidase